MLNPSLIHILFKAAGMQRWNDRIRPVEMRELDKQAHKMIIAFVLARSFEERHNHESIDWIALIEGGFFEFLQRVMLTDLKPELFDRIRSDSKTFRKLKDWAFDQLRADLESVSKSLGERYLAWFDSPDHGIEKKMLRAAHVYATRWEFRILEHAAPSGFDSSGLREGLDARLRRTVDWKDEALTPPKPGPAAFIDLCGELRFQVRWSHLSIIPRISVLGHMLIVAFLAYLLSIEIGACASRRVNNCLTGLFHDLPEVLTRDVIDPVKRSVEGLGNIIKDYEKREMEEKVLSLLPPSWHQEIRLYTENEFSGSIVRHGRRIGKTTDEIHARYNQDGFSPRDGELVRVCDHLAAFVETCRTLGSGLRHPDIIRAHGSLLDAYREKRIAGYPVGDLFTRMALETGLEAE